jgi:putative Mg2+ transporter-C (MgtC) family protein
MVSGAVRTKPIAMSDSFLESWLPDLTILGQSLIALFLGGIIGWERERAGKWAGFRTHMLVCLAAMLFVRVGEILVVDFSGSVGVEILRADPMRLTEAIVTGIAFIGAGSVFRDRSGHFAQGLTTAATLLAVGPIGVAVALNRYVLAAGTTVLVVLVLRVLGKLERIAMHRDQKQET